MPPFWPAYGAPASVDWCEPNYVHSPYVAEWWNTWSSLPIAFLGFVALVWALGPRFREDRRFVVGAVVLAVVGLGSAAFHGTLLRWAQALDELPMVYCGLAFVYALRWRTDEGLERRRIWQVGLLVYAAAFTVVYALLPSLFLFFILVYAGLVTWLVVRSAWVSFRVKRDPRRVGLFALSAGSYVGGVFGLWIPEHVLLPCDHPLQSLPLHAVFHLTSALGSYAWLLWAAYDRQDVLRRRVERVWPTPRVA